MPKRTRKSCTGLVLNLDFQGQVSPDDWGQWLRDREVNYYVFSLERGETGRYHFQCTVQWPTPRDWSAFATATKEKFGLRGDQAVQCQSADINLSRYCMKSESHVDGPWTWGTYKGRGRPAKVNHFDRNRSLVLAMYEGVTWRPFQTWILGLLEGKPHPRHIYWCYDDGDTGKSYLARYLMCQTGVVLGGGSTADIAHKIRGSVELGIDVRLIIMDVPKTVTKINYAALENIKNGIINATKYESLAFVIPPPHVVVFANYVPPDGVYTQNRLIKKHTKSVV